MSKFAAQNQSLCHKTAVIFNTITHNTPVDSLNQHMFCDLLGNIARSPQIKKKWLISLRCYSLSVATLPPRQFSLRGNSPGITICFINFIIQLWR
jgi:hypothetical protein